MNFQIRNFERTIPSQEYLDGFRDEEKFLEFCKECGNFGNCWACPPFDSDWTPVMKGLDSVTLYVTQLIFGEARIPYSEAHTVIRPERLKIESRLRELETQTGGRAFAFAGKCLYCPEQKCSRIEGQPCRHPDLVRPSLEAVGFDITKTAKELFDLDILWSKDGYLPPYYLLVSGLFHNTPANK